MRTVVGSPNGRRSSARQRRVYRDHGVATAALLTASLFLAGCTTGTAGGGDATEADVTDATEPVEVTETVVEETAATPTHAPTVTLITHDSWDATPRVLQQFTDQTGLEIEVLPVGDAGTLANQVVLTADAPLGDVVFGIDNTFASRVEDAGAIDGGLHPITQGDVCLNVDSDWFTEHNLREPNTLDDIIAPDYSGLTVVLNPASSSPGLAFLLATVGAFGSDDAFDPAAPGPYDSSWQAYWAALRANDVAVAESWTDGYYGQFSGAGEGGTRPIVVSYATSPAYTVDAEHTKSSTRAILGTCFRQTEYAGVLAGAANPVGGQKLVDFLGSPEFQADIPERMFMYPTNAEVALPTDWARFAPQAERPFTVDSADIAAHRDQWIDEWTRIVVE